MLLARVDEVRVLRSADLQPLYVLSPRIDLNERDLRVTSLLLLPDQRHVAVGGTGGHLIVYHVDFARWSTVAT